MPTYPSASDEGASKFDSLKRLKEERAQDAEKIRQDFIKSHGLTVNPGVGQNPSPELTEDE
jgi:hypothetical protein